MVYYDDSDFSSDYPTYTSKVPGTKLFGVKEFLNSNPHLVDDYDYFWLLEDDLFIPFETILLALDFLERIQPVLCAPSLTPYSFYVHPIMIQSDALFVRGTDFVECMAPIMSRSFLKATLDQFSVYQIYGIERVWQDLLWKMREVAYILDAAPITHTRPIGGGKLYDIASGLGIDKIQDDRDAHARYGKPYNRYINTLFGVDNAALPRLFVGAELRAALQRGAARFLRIDQVNADSLDRVLAHSTFANDLFTRFLAFGSVQRLLYLPPISEQEADLIVRNWTFGSSQKGVYAERMRLLANGRIGGYPNDNEYSWKLEGDTLLFISRHGAVTTRFLERHVDDGRIVFEGPYQHDESFIHYLKERLD